MVSLIGVILAFTMILVFIKHKINLGLAMIAAGILVGVTSGLGLSTLTLLLEGLLEPSTLELLGIVVMIGILGYILTETGSMKKILDSLFELIYSPKILLMLAPGLISLLNVPGGAIMSAPMVDEIGNKVNLSPEEKTSINLFYRHIWYFCYPLNQTLIMTGNLSGIEKNALIAYSFPAMIVGILSSYMFNFRKINFSKKLDSDKKIKINSFKELLLNLMPLIIVLILGLVFKVNFLCALVIGIIIALLNNNERKKITSLKDRVFMGWNRAKIMIIPGINKGLVYSFAGIMMFRKVIEASGILPVFSDFLIGLGIPLWILIIIVAVVASIATGLSPAAIGLTIPLFMPLLPGGLANIGYIGLLYITATLGYLVSPIHLCLALTKEYFEANLLGVYKEVAIPIASIIVVSIITTLILI